MEHRSARRDHGDLIRQERQARERELAGFDDYPAAVAASNNWTEQQRILRRAAGLKDSAPLLGEITEQQARRRELAGLPPELNASTTTPRTGYFPVLSEEAHRRLDALDEALVASTAAIDGKAEVNVHGYPPVMSSTELWNAIESEKNALRHAARP